MSDAFWMAFFAVLVSILDLIVTARTKRSVDKIDGHINGFVDSEKKEK